LSSAAELLERITETVDYLRVTIDPGSGDWIRCEPLVTDPAVLGDLVRSTKSGRGTDRDDVATSLFVQGYAFRIASLAIGGWVMGDAVLDLAPRHCAIALGRHRPNAVALDEANVVSTDDPLRVLHELVVDRHLGELVASAHQVCRIGEALLWGNVAAACASSFGAFAGALPERGAEIRDRAEAFFAAARSEVAGAGRIERVGARWAWERKSCCLWYLTESAFKCEDCSLWSAEERRARYAAVLAEEAGA
jgi:ferric iron reductase protein FhuF